MADHLHKFLFEGLDNSPSAVRGEIVSIAEAWRQIRARHDYPVPVMRMLGEMVAASTLLTANLKFDGALVMQIHGDGPVQLLVVECQADLTLRATAKLAEGAEVSETATFEDMVNANGNGRFAITLDPREKLPGQQAYQGIVALDGDTVAQVLENYMLRSEQLDTHLWLAADANHANGLLLQRLPVQEGPAAFESAAAVGAVEQEDRSEMAAETWNRAVTIARTLESEELLAVDSQTLMNRLFWDETLRVFDPQPVVFRCSCSRARVAAMLVMLGHKEIEDTVADQGGVHVNCDFCNRAYDFDPVDCAQLFATSNTADGVREARHLRH